jgi:mono/diheme cytochrome c family protein
MRTNRIKLFAIIFFALPLMFITIFDSSPVKVAAAKTTDDPAVTYKTKCAACHTPAAAKFYDPAKTDDEHLTAIMKGKKGEKPPFMPGFEAKGMTEDEAKALAAYMKGLRPAAN